MRLKINVSQRDIQKGVPTSRSKCPIARACKRHKLSSVCVDPDRVWFVFGRRYYCSFLPKKARQFTGAFDRGEKVKPFCFTLNPEALDPFKETDD